MCTDANGHVDIRRIMGKGGPGIRTVRGGMVIVPNVGDKAIRGGSVFTPNSNGIVTSCTLIFASKKIIKIIRIHFGWWGTEAILM